MLTVLPNAWSLRQSHWALASNLYGTGNQQILPESAWRVRPLTPNELPPIGRGAVPMGADRRPWCEGSPLGARPVTWVGRQRVPPGRVTWVVWEGIDHGSVFVEWFGEVMCRLKHIAIACWSTPFPILFWAPGN